MAKVTSFEMDERAEQVLNQVKKELGVKTNAAALKKAIQVLKIVSENCDSNGVFTFETKDHNKQQIIIK